MFLINNTNNGNLISFDNQTDYNNNKQSATNNANSNFNFLNNNNNSQNMINSNSNNFPNNSFPLNNASSDLMDMKSGDNIVEEKLKKITDNIEELYKNPNIYSAGSGANAQNTSNKQNDLFNALNPQLNNSMNVKHNIGNINFMNNPQNLQQQQMNNFYNYGNNNQPNQNYLNNNNHFYGNGMNMGFNNVHGIGTSGFQGGYGANYTGYPNGINYNQNHVFNGQQQMNYTNNNTRNMMANNNYNNGVLTANDIYNKKDDSIYNLNYNGLNAGSTNNFSNTDFLGFSDAKPKKSEDPFSNLISFK